MIHAFRTDASRHAVCKPWLDGVVRDQARFGLSPLVLSAVVRITTNPRSYLHPSPIEGVFAFCDNLLRQPHCEIIEPGERHWSIFKRLCGEAQIRGPEITDAWFAALAIEHACVWITYDRDFAKFRGLRWREPSI